MNREFTELLKGCRPVKDKDGNIVVQSIMNMQVVCLTTDAEFSLDSRFGNPMTALSVSNSRYGQMRFNNREDKEVIIPNQMAVMTKQSAQNHSMIKAGYIDRKDSVTFSDAGCVQGSQTGYISNSQEFRMIPVTMREMLLNSVGISDSYSRIYPAINRLGSKTSTNTDDYLHKYFDKFDKKLEEFIAHFERPNNLIGIIVLIDGEIIAIDKFPSFTYAEQVWDSMIRDCYGSLAIISELNNKSKLNKFTSIYEESKRNLNGASIVDLLEATLKKTKNTMSESIHTKISELLDISFVLELDNDGNSASSSRPISYVLKHDGYIGQVISESDFNYLVSVVKKESFNPNALRAINELKRKARRQDRFTL